MSSSHVQEISSLPILNEFEGSRAWPGDTPGCIFVARVPGDFSGSEYLTVYATCDGSWTGTRLATGVQPLLSSKMDFCNAVFMQAFPVYFIYFMKHINIVC